EAKEGLGRGFLGREAHAQEGEGLLGLCPQPLLSLKLLVDLLSLSCEERKLSARLLEARFEPVPRGGQDIGLGARGRRLGLEPLAPPLDLRQALAQLAGRAGHLGPLSRRPDLRAHLLAALEETLELALELLRRLAQVGEPVVAFLDSGAQRRLA